MPYFDMIKSNPCKECGSVWHTAMYHKPRKPIKVNKPIEAYRTPLKKKAYIYSSLSKKPVKRVVLKPQGNSKRSKLIKEADRRISRFVRQSQSIGGYGVCVTCGTRDRWQNLDAGHFISRRKMAVRYDLMNLHPQCQRCNRELGGNLKNYRAYILMKYKQEGLEELYDRAKKPKIVTIALLTEIIEKYKNYG